MAGRDHYFSCRVLRGVFCVMFVTQAYTHRALLTKGTVASSTAICVRNYVQYFCLLLVVFWVCLFVCFVLFCFSVCFVLFVFRFVLFVFRGFLGFFCAAFFDIVCLMWDANPLRALKNIFNCVSLG